jgi:hypothetical protein
MSVTVGIERPQPSESSTWCGVRSFRAAVTI